MGTADGLSFDERQQKLQSLLGSGSASDLDDGTLVIVPSLTFPEAELQKIVGIGYYEERLLFLLLLLARPNLRIVFASSLRVEEPIVDYYLRFVPAEVKPGDRLYLLSMWDQTPRSLTEKVLERPEAIERLSSFAGERSCLLTFNVTERERRLSDATGLPLYGCPPDLVSLGHKSGSRQVAREAGVPVLPGAENLHSMAEIEAAIEDIKRQSPDAQGVVVKLDQGFSGQGNAIIEIANASAPLTAAPTTFCAEEESWASFEAKIAAEGAIVEELVRGDHIISPSVQMRIAPDGSYEVISTHDQVLGGPDGHVYLGCRFPASEPYRTEIQELGRRVAKVLSARGVMGSFGVDFLVIPEGDGRSIYLTEINLRLGGTTHPFLMAEYVTGGTFDAASGELLVDGAPRAYVSTDNLKSPGYVGLEPADLIAQIDRAGLGFDAATGSGVTLHLLGALKRFGKVGMTCIARSRAEADELYRLAVAELDALASEGPRD
jgi:hypothetical protein